MFGRLGGVSPLLLSEGCFRGVSGFLLFPFENLRPGLEVVGQKVAQLLGRFGDVSPRHLHSATFRQLVIILEVSRGREARCFYKRAKRRGRVMFPSFLF